MARERLCAAEADRELRDLERVEEAEALLLAPLDEEREGRAGAGAMAVENILLTRIGDEPQIAESLDLGMVAQICADLQRIFARAAHAQFERFEAAQQQARKRVVQGKSVSVRVVLGGLRVINKKILTNTTHHVLRL